MLRIPSKKAFVTYLLLCVQLCLVFVVLYGATNWLADQRSFSLKLWMDWELLVPLLPFMILPYLSINFLNVVPLFVFDDQEMKQVGKRYLFATVMACAIFLLLPAHIGWPRSTENLGIWKVHFENLYSLDKTANSFPSLHITYSALVVRSYCRKQLDGFAFVLMLWLCCIMASVVLIHQHHIIDIVGGLLLAEWSVRKFPLVASKA